MGPAFWAEPVNAVTNFAFILAAVFVALAWRNSTHRSAAVLFLGIWIGIIGIGSFLFHTFATRWAAIADSVPILVFILAYLYLALRHFLGLPIWAGAVISLAFVPASIAVVPLIAPMVGSSAGYVPALLTIFIVGFLMLGRDRRVAVGLLITAGIFLASIGFRIADEPVCKTFPIGTHFIWHMLNAVVLYRLTMIYHRRHEGIVPQ
ncbi:ceramidase domain-containing protein [Hoeflea sp. TYP-13]|uniref:ceramidase domain-containing protein n=1 Tax=Hoeflea sp. TYP-13 TaxID=3230023 RepID=UPI0034C5E082